MTTRYTQNNKGEIFFISFTCFKWINLIDRSDSYVSFYKWFDYLKAKRISLIAYVIMPNHFHCLIYLPIDSEKNINTIIANAKRFIAYDIVSRLREKKEIDLLAYLNKSLSIIEKGRKQKHKVFISSFDCKEIHSEEMFYIKLDYIHHNPCKGKWSLAEDYSLYKHSSAGFYERNERNSYLTHFDEVL